MEEIVDKNVACFIHSCNLDITGTEILEYEIDYLNRIGFLSKCKYVIINNIGKPIQKNKFEEVGKNIMIINHSKDTNLFENCTLRLMHFFSQLNSDFKILYLHTKGVSYKKDHPYYYTVKDWTDFMLYCLGDKYNDCVKMLDYVDIVGTNYRNKKYDGNPTHFSGNFWWARADYIRNLLVENLNGKYDAEFWVFENCPKFIHIHKCPYGHYENRYHRLQYAGIVDYKINQFHNILKNLSKETILYGIDNNYVDVTAICYQQLCQYGILKIPCGDHERNNIFGDHLVGSRKHIRIGNLDFPYEEEICLPLTSSSS